eukprot:gene11770-11915_t
MSLNEVSEEEHATPKPSLVLVMLQVDPIAAEPLEQMTQQLMILAQHPHGHETAKQQ